MRRKQKHENLLLNTAFVITRQKILNLTTNDNLIAVSVYVAYRRPFPDEETVDKVVKELKENNIEYDQFADWPAVNCQ